VRRWIARPRRRSCSALRVWLRSPQRCSSALPATRRHTGPRSRCFASPVSRWSNAPAACSTVRSASASAAGRCSGVTPTSSPSRECARRALPCGVRGALRSEGRPQARGTHSDQSFSAASHVQRRARSAHVLIGDAGARTAGAGFRRVWRIRLLCCGRKLPGRDRSHAIARGRACAGLPAQNAPPAVRFARVSYSGVSRDGLRFAPQHVASQVLKVSSYASRCRSLGALIENSGCGLLWPPVPPLRHSVNGAGGAGPNSHSRRPWRPSQADLTAAVLHFVSVRPGRGRVRVRIVFSGPARTRQSGYGVRCITARPPT